MPQLASRACACLIFSMSATVTPSSSPSSSCISASASCPSSFTTKRWAMDGCGTAGLVHAGFFSFVGFWTRVLIGHCRCPGTDGCGARRDRSAPHARQRTQAGFRCGHSHASHTHTTS
eukprot:15442042-Alexandrium_andersonii.AAC.1